MRIALVFLLLLSGCAPTVWNRAGSTKEEFSREQYECQRDAAYVRDSVQGLMLYENCMQSKGWQKKNS